MQNVRLTIAVTVQVPDDFNVTDRLALALDLKQTKVVNLSVNDFRAGLRRPFLTPRLVDGKPIDYEMVGVEVLEEDAFIPHSQRGWMPADPPDLRT